MIRAWQGVVVWAGLLLASSCNPRHPSSQSPVRAAEPLAIPQPPLAPGEVWGPQDDANTRRIHQIFRDTLVKNTGDDPMMRRDAHPRHHGCVRGIVTIDPHALREEHRQGLFAQEGEYEAWVRFSNGHEDHQRADDKPDFRGMAVKIMQVPYSSYLAEVGVEQSNPVHDLVLLNSPTFFIRSTGEYLELMEATAKGGGAVAGFAMSNGKLMKIIQESRTMKVGNVLDLDYHSATPYRLGPAAMRMTMASCKPEADRRPRRPSPRYLGDRLEASLAEQEHCFVFYVQPNEDPTTCPIEDPTRAWDPAVSPLYEVGRLTLPQQTGVRDPEAMELCEHMSFNPWRAPEVNRPLGQANRVRLEVYGRQSELRHEHNAKEEPRPVRFDRATAR